MIPAGYEWARDGQYLPGDRIMLGLWGPSTRRVIVVDVLFVCWGRLYQSHRERCRNALSIVTFYRIGVTVIQLSIGVYVLIEAAVICDLPQNVGRTGTNADEYCRPDWL